jgi:hypothetical protein
MGKDSKKVAEELQYPLENLIPYPPLHSIAIIKVSMVAAWFSYER